VPQFVCGKYNTTNNTTSLFVVGNGTNTSTRSDLLNVDSDNSIRFNGTAYIAKGLNLNQKEVGPNSVAGSGYGYGPHLLGINDYCVFIYADNTGITTIVEIQQIGTVPIGTTYIIKNCTTRGGGGLADITINQSNGTQRIDATTGPVALAPGTGYQIIYTGDGFWQIIGRF
jgi:hypothetical protein